MKWNVLTYILYFSVKYLISLFLFQKEENDVGEFFLTLEKDPQQEDFLQGRMQGNPYRYLRGWIWATLGWIQRNKNNKARRKASLFFWIGRYIIAKPDCWSRCLLNFPNPWRSYSDGKQYYLSYGAIFGHVLNSPKIVLWLLQNARSTLLNNAMLNWNSLLFGSPRFVALRWFTFF